MTHHHYPESFEEYLKASNPNGGVVSEAFEERVYQLLLVLSKIVDVFKEASIRYELIGGLAVLAHVHDTAPAEERTTKDVDVMINRADLDTIKLAAAKHGFRYRHTPDVDMLMTGDEDVARDAVHLVFSEELSSPRQLLPNPALNPIVKSIRGLDVMVVPVVDLVRMKLASFRLKDQVHIQALDRAGLITPQLERELTAELRARLEYVRSVE